MGRVYQASPFASRRNGESNLSFANKLNRSDVPSKLAFAELVFKKAEKAWFSKLEVGGEFTGRTLIDFAVIFSDIQELQQLQQKLLRMSMVLNSCLEVASHLKGYCQRLIAISDIIFPSGLVLKAIKNYTTDIKIHEKSLAMIKQSLEWTERLVKWTIFIPSLPKKVSLLANSTFFPAIVERDTHFLQRSNPPIDEPNDLQKCRSRV